jgi:hypothetical protein
MIDFDRSSVQCRNQDQVVPMGDAPPPADAGAVSASTAVEDVEVQRGGSGGDDVIADGDVIRDAAVGDGPLVSTSADVEASNRSALKRVLFALFAATFSVTMMLPAVTPLIKDDVYDGDSSKASSFIGMIVWHLVRACTSRLMALARPRRVGWPASLCAHVPLRWCPRATPLCA